MHKCGVDVRLDSQAKYDDREFDEDGRLIMLSADALSEVEFQRHEAGRIK